MKQGFLKLSMMLLLISIAGCANHVSQKREQYLNWATQQARMFQQTHTSHLPTLQFFACGDLHHPCYGLSAIHHSQFKTTINTTAKHLKEHA